MWVVCILLKVTNLGTMLLRSPLLMMMMMMMMMIMLIIMIIIIRPTWAVGVLSGVRDVETYNRGRPS
jgi:hypothetical protein